MFLDLLDVYKPTTHSTVDQRLFSAVAEGIGVKVVLPLYQQFMLLQIGNDILVRVLDETTREIWYLVGKTALQINRTNNRNVCSFEHLIVIFTETRCCMDNATTIFGGYIITHHTNKGTLFFQICKIWEQGFITHAFIEGTFCSSTIS